MSWQYAYTTACEADSVKPRDELAAQVELEALTLNGNAPERFSHRVNDTELSTLCKALSSVSTVTEVDLSYNNIGNDGAIAFADLLRKNTSIQFVSLAHNNIGPEGARAIADALMLNMTVVSISLRGNPIDDEGGIAIGTMIRGNNTLVSLDLGNCGLATKSLVSIVQGLMTHPALCAMHLDKPLLKGPHDIQYVVQHLANTIARSNVLVELSLAHWSLYDDHLAALLPALVQNSSITRLSLAGNKLSFDGGLQIGKLLGRRPDITTLDASSNNLNDQGAVAIGDAVKAHPSLSRLVLNSNGIGERGLVALARAVSASLSLQELLLWGNKFSPVAAKAFYETRARLEQLAYYDFELYVVDGVVMLARRND